MNNLVQHHNSNAQSINNALQGLDVLSQVTQRVMNDLQHGSSASRSIYLDEQGDLDIPKYIAEYYGAVGVAQFLHAYRASIEAAAAAAEEPVDDNVVVFGG